MRSTLLRTFILALVVVAPVASHALDFDTLIEKRRLEADSVVLTIGKKKVKYAKSDVKTQTNDDFSVVLRPIRKKS